MDTPMTAVRRTQRTPLAPLGKLTAAALLLHALVYVAVAFLAGPRPIILAHIAVPLAVAGIVATRYRWAPALGALLGGLLLVDGFVILGERLASPDNAIAYAMVATILATALVALVAGLGATLQNYRARYSDAAVPGSADRPAPRWTYPALAALAALVLGGTLSTAIQPRSIPTGVSPEALAALPVLQAKDFQFDPMVITAKVGENVALQLVNADSTIHYFDIDEFNVHATLPAGESNVALFKPPRPGTYTFYCHAHGNKAADTGHVGRLIVSP
ncbi:MAG: cupredoxin domain-containing protein [Chloroflexota bacterium]|nr:cupredoxin domain-containing protein [Chloroflexota bacterium]